METVKYVSRSGPIGLTCYPPSTNSPCVVAVIVKNYPCLELVHVAACYSCVRAEKNRTTH